MSTNIYLSLNNCPCNDSLKEAFLTNPDFKVVDSLENEKVTVVVNGPLTQLATLLQINWQLASNIEQILFVGGTDKYGDVTPVAEKNVYDDVYSAQYIFLSGIKIVMFGLNVTRNLENRAILPYLYLTKPESFEKEECGVYVETKGEVTKGMTVTDLYSDKQFDNHFVEIIKKINL